MTIAVDFDQVLHNKAAPIKGRRMGPPLPGAKESLEMLREAGHNVIIHTTIATNPSGAKAVEDWLDYYDMEHDGVTAIKPVASFYIDDKAIRHISWADTIQQLEDLGVDI
jgi:hypothetical protein